MSLPVLPILLVSIVLFFVLFFGIGFLLNMLLRMTWIMAIIYPIVAIFIIQDVKLINYFREPSTSFVLLGDKLSSLALVDIMILMSGLLGAITSGIVIKMLRSKGYQMF
ncbi:YuiB family protein [Litchfieldia alkalitelluris]|uniref:YuiB family protein n=1 Tax=Litchfieldia alkalitelluris TaxID=304268 RepID=UPI00099801D6|nr:YuiB family protein [Litchfieldia alkalitelluris]